MAEMKCPEVPETSRIGSSGFPKNFPIPDIPLGMAGNGNGSANGKRVSRER
jgi:hypothetical protein